MRILVDIDFTKYRLKNDMRSVKKNCTIPSWLNFEAEKAGINFSSVLQKAYIIIIYCDDAITSLSVF